MDCANTSSSAALADETPELDNAPRQVSAQAVAFLAAIGREPMFRFRALPESPNLKGKDGVWPAVLVGTFEEHAQQLRRLNDAGYGVFVQVNRSNGEGDRAENIVAAPCLFADFDGVPLTDVDRLALPPHVTVETSPGKRHFYWRVDGIQLDQFPALQKRLIALFASDKSIHDLPRVMRLPGFLHQKDPNAPHLVSLVATIDAAAYTLSEFMAALQVAEQRLGLPSEKTGNSAISRPVSALPSAELGAELFRAASAIRHSVAAKALDLAEHSEWIRVGIALKASYGEAGFPLWVELSREADGFADEDDATYRKRWVSIGDDKREGRRLTVATFIKQAQDCGWKRSSNPAVARQGRSGTTAWGGPDDDAPILDSESAVEGGGSGGGKGRGKPDDATIVIEQARAAGDEYFVDKDRVPHVRFRRRAGDDAAPWTVSRIHGEAYRDTLRRRFHQGAVIKMLSKEQLGNALDLLAAEARELGNVRAVHLRHGMHDGCIYIDLGRSDGKAVRVDVDGWRVVDEAPVLFRTGSRGALPLPEPGGTIEMLAGHMPSLDRWGVQRVLAFSIGVFNPNGAQSMLLFTGPRGTYKSNLEDMTLAITDPPVGRQDGRFSFSGDERDLVIHAMHNAVLSFDNLSSFSKREADWVCRLLTGTAFATRKLYSDMEEQTFTAKRPMVGTGIGMPSNQEDFLDRLLPVETHVGSLRRTEAAVWRDFERDHAKLFGLVLTGVSHALCKAAQCDETENNGARLADLASFAEGAHKVLQLSAGEFTRRLQGEQGSLQSEAAAGDPVGDALIRHFSLPYTKPISCTGPELLTLLSDGLRERDRDWPNKFKARTHLQRIAGGLLLRGIRIDFRKDAAKNQWMIDVATTPDFQPMKLPSSRHC